MRVKAISEIPSAKGLIPVGQILEISPALLEKLKGKVEVITDQPTKVLSKTHGANQPTTSSLKKPMITTTIQVEPTRAGIVYTSPPRCYACSSVDLWRSRHGATVCRVCHPPAPGAETAARGTA